MFLLPIRSCFWQWFDGSAFPESHMVYMLSEAAHVYTGVGWNERAWKLSDVDDRYAMNSP